MAKVQIDFDIPAILDTIFDKRTVFLGCLDTASALYKISTGRSGGRFGPFCFCTEALYGGYTGLVRRLQRPCTDRTRPVYGSYKTEVQMWAGGKIVDFVFFNSLRLLFPCCGCISFRQACLSCKIVCQKYVVWIILHLGVYKLQNLWHKRVKIVIKCNFTEF